LHFYVIKLFQTRKLNYGTQKTTSYAAQAAIIKPGKNGYHIEKKPACTSEQNQGPQPWYGNFS
jgi:hypothetical protein